MEGLPPGGGMASRWSRPVRGFFGRRCARPEDAEDLAQDALCAIVEGAARFRGGASEATWVYAICRNVFASWLRSREREARLAEAASREALAAGRDSGGGTGSAAPGGGVPSGSDRPGGEDLLCLGLDLERALSSLRPSERRLYVLYYVEGKPVADIAEILGKPAGTEKYLLHGLRSRLRTLLGT